MNCLLSRSANLLNIERVLLIAERYILSVEELHTAARSILPHGASFQGLPLTFNVVCDAHKKEFPIQVGTAPVLSGEILLMFAVCNSAEEEDSA